MKILYLKLNNGYSENWTYQENIMPGKMVAMGHEVHLIVPAKTTDESGKTYIRDACEYVNDYGVHVHVLDYARGKFLFKKIIRFRGLYENIQRIQPDLIYVQGPQFINILEVLKYVKLNQGVRLILDNHADFINMPVDNLKRIIAQKVVMRYIMQRLIPYTEYFWGCAPMRAEYLSNVYKIPEHKIGILKQGGDELIVNSINREAKRSQIVSELNIPENDLIIVTGGKIDSLKKIDRVFQSVYNMKGVTLIVFGSFSENMKEKVQKYFHEKSNIHYVGWISGRECYSYFKLADITVFPGQHSVLWDQAVASGTPCIVKYWKGLDYFDVNGNCSYLKEGTSEEITNIITNLVMNPSDLKAMKLAASLAKKEFSYMNITKIAIREE